MECGNERQARLLFFCPLSAGDNLSTLWEAAETAGGGRSIFQDYVLSALLSRGRSGRGGRLEKQYDRVGAALGGMHGI